MTDFFDHIAAISQKDRAYLQGAPIIQKSVAGEVTVEDYAAFLSQAYQHVKHTVPLLMATGARLPDRLEWLRREVAGYIEEELGHEEWILNDIAACGFDADSVRHSQPGHAVDVMVAYAYDMVMRRNPVGFFGMVYVLETTSVALADQAASAMSTALGLPETAFTYLRTHGALDQDHTKQLRRILAKLDDAPDRDAIEHTARAMYHLYGDVFRTLDDLPNPIRNTEVAA